MATTANLMPGATPKQSSDPFVSTPSPFQTSQLRYASLDNDQFTTYTSNSPAQARRALEAHLKETDRRIHDAAKLGNNLLEQKKNLAARLQDIENVQTDDEVPAALRQKLAELEKEYNEVGRESARAFLPKLRPSKSDANTLSGQGASSPSKVLAPSRRQRNAPNARVHDIEFATEISTSLLAQVRQLQAALSDKDESLKDTATAKAQLESDLAGLTQRVKQLDEQSQLHKDENWNLETRIQELEGALKTSNDNAQRLGQTLKSTETAKSTAQRDLDELKLSHDKAIESHLDAKRQQDNDLHGLRRDVANHEADKTLLQKKIEELTSNNTELARAVSYRFNQPGAEAALADELDKSDNDQDESVMDLDMSPVKGTPARPGMLESETLKSSLNHAHRMMQNLKNTLHREKSEKLELRRMLNDARDELEKRKVDVGSRAVADKNKKRTAERDNKRRPVRLGVAGAATTEITEDEPEWEDDSQKTPARSRNFSANMPGAFISASATDAESTDAFETADELRDTATETEGFETGAEHFNDDSDELTETEGLNRSGTVRGAPTHVAPGHVSRRSFDSTASASSADEDSFLRTPSQSGGPKYRLRVSKSARRSLRQDQIMSDSPASNNSTPQHPGQNLGDELDALDDESMEGTPSKIRAASLASPETQRSFSNAGTPLRDSASPFVVGPVLQQPPSPPTHEGDQTVLVHEEQAKPAMVDAGIMTEPWQPESVPAAVADNVQLPFVAEADASSRPVTATEQEPTLADSGEEEQKTPLKGLGERLVGAAGGALAGFGLGRIGKDKSPEPEAAREGSLRPDSEILPRTSPSSSVSVPTMSFSSIISQDHEPSTAPSVVPEIWVPATPSLPKRSSKRLGSLSRSPTESSDVPMPVELGAASPPKTPTTTRSYSQTTAVEDSGPQREYVEPKVYGGGRGANGIPTLVFGDDELDSVITSTPTRPPMQAMSSNISRGSGAVDDTLISTTTAPLPDRRPMHDEGSQTIVSGREIDNMMRDKAGVLADEEPRSPRRPGSSGSTRQRVAVPTPPLPPDHDQKIAAAAKTPAPKSVPGSMGPPLLPASAYKGKLQTTPAERSIRGMSRDGTTPRAARTSVRESSMSGRASRSTSVSSFASEVDERFQLNRNHLMYPDDVAPATDPRMIQAITQTMIGEYLWKYTRKAGRVEKSSTRHRRFFWVHPYTRTLYWSEQDPSTTNKGMMRAKSVPIESVRVITDDNVNPPGLHRKSIVIVSRSREIVVTAPTSQRHETWFNALSYLLLRSAPEKEAEDTINDDDLEEFNPVGFSFRRSISKMTRGRSRSRVSMSSYNSRATRNESPAKRDAAAAAAVPEQQTIRKSHSGAPVAASVSSRRQRDTSRFGSMASRFSTARGGSALSHRTEGEVYNSSAMGESAEDVRQMIETSDRNADLVENVRACCDGKHDVGSLSHRHTSLRSRLSTSTHHVHKTDGTS